MCAKMGCAVLRDCLCVFYISHLEAVVEALGFRLDLLGVFQHPLIQHQRLAPLLHQHIRLSDEETPVRGPEGRTT